MITVEAPPTEGLIGTSPPRLDAWEKVNGRLLYTGDMTMAGMLHGKILWSAHPHALIRRIDTRAAKALPGVHAVLTHEDVAGPNRYGVAVLDQRVLAVALHQADQAVTLGHTLDERRGQHRRDERPGH